MTRQEANKEILNELSKLIDDYPDMRFSQFLQLARIELSSNDYYKEPQEILTVLKKELIHG